MKTLLTALPAILAGLLCSCGSMYGDLADESTGDVTGLWRSVDSMPTARAVPSLAELNGKVYAAGGIIGGKCTNAFETYDLRTGKWSVLKPNTAGATWMGKRKWAGCCAYNGRIYVAGGCIRRPFISQNIRPRDEHLVRRPGTSRTRAHRLHGRSQRHDICRDLGPIINLLF